MHLSVIVPRIADHLLPISHAHREIAVAITPIQRVWIINRIGHRPVSKESVEPSAWTLRYQDRLERVHSVAGTLNQITKHLGPEPFREIACHEIGRTILRRHHCVVVSPVRQRQIGYLLISGNRVLV